MFNFFLRQKLRKLGFFTFWGTCLQTRLRLGGGSTTSAGLGSTLRNKAARFFFSTSAPLGALVLLVASDVCLWTCLSPLAHEQLRSNFKVQLRWLPLTESTQIFLCDSVCVSSNRKSKKNWTGHGQKAAALWPITTYTKFGHVPS